MSEREAELLAVVTDLFDNPEFQINIGGDPTKVVALWDRARAALAMEDAPREQNGEREQIVAWLRDEAQRYQSPLPGEIIARVATAIERGDHTSTPAPSSLAEQPAPYTCKHGCERDSLMDRHAALVEALTNMRRGIEQSQWHYINGERFKRVLVAETAIERIDATLATIRKETQP